MLRSVPSDPDKNPWLVRLGRTEALCVQKNKKKWTSASKSVSDKVWVCLNEYRFHVTEEQSKDDTAEFPNHAARFIEYITFALMDQDSTAVVKTFVEMVADVTVAKPSLFRLCCCGLIAMSRSGTSPLSDPDLAILGEWRVRFKSSKIWGAWLAEKAAEQLAEPREKHLEGCWLVDLATQLQSILETKLPEEIKRQAEFAQTMFGPVAVMPPILQLVQETILFEKIMVKMVTTALSGPGTARTYSKDTRGEGKKGSAFLNCVGK